MERERERERCVKCGKHPLAYIHCDEWRCPLLRLKLAQEGTERETEREEWEDRDCDPE